MWQLSWESEKKNWPIFKTFYSNWGKNENANEKNWEKFDFWILHIKIRLNENFHENLRKKMTEFSRHFWLFEAKNEDEDEKF